MLSRCGAGHISGNPETMELPVVHTIADSDIEYVLGLHEDIAVGWPAATSARDTTTHTTRTLRWVRPRHFRSASRTPLNAGLTQGRGDLYTAQMAGAPPQVTAANHSLDFRTRNGSVGRPRGDSRGSPRLSIFRGEAPGLVVRDRRSL